MDGPLVERFAAATASWRRQETHKAMAENGKLKLELVDVYGKRLQESVDVTMRHTKFSQNLFFKGRDASKFLQINDLHTATDGPYQISIDPPSYHRVSRFVSVKTSGITEEQIPFPVDASKVVSLNPPKFAALSKEIRNLLSNSSNVSGFEGKTGQELFDAVAVDDIKMAGLLNIACKTLATVYADGANALSLVKELRLLRGDRFFAVVENGLREQTLNSVHSGLFNKVSGALHHLPPEFPGFEPADSFKTNDHFGNLQLTFFRKGDEFVADIDIDDANGIEHVFQVLHNHFTGEPTHPYNIHEILVFHQHLDPKYTFNL
jgi:hypothetical protein